jgi:hypothetical protein
MQNNIDVRDAIEAVIKTVASACGNNFGQFQTEIGKTIRQCQTRFIRNEKPNALGRLVQGGYVEIDLNGEEQPEASRIIDNMIERAMKEADINLEEWRVDNRDTRRFTKKDPKTGANTAGRMIKFKIPDHKAAKFAESLYEISRIVGNSPELAEQCYKGVLCSQEVINPIKGLTTQNVIEAGAVKPYVKLNIPAREDAPSSGLAKPAYFTLQLDGVPESLAKDIKSEFGLSYKESDERRSRDLKHSFAGGLTIEIPIKEPDFSRVIEKIKNYTPPYVRKGDAGIGRPALPGM